MVTAVVSQQRPQQEGHAVAQSTRVAVSILKLRVLAQVDHFSVGVNNLSLANHSSIFSFFMRQFNEFDCSNRNRIPPA
jgi:hypothetical protein